MRSAILDQNRDMASDALRVLGVAFRALDAIPAKVSPETVEKDLVFVGLLGMIDPPRPEVIEALKVAKGAGLKTVMVTGDYKDTAEAIARDIGLRTPDGLVLTGAEIDKLSDEELAARADRLDVCCRVSPQHKTRIVEAFKARDHVVAMTGDGVNDAPALKRANIGVAMGITGTDVAKQTADMVLTDDNFASIVSAIEQGRIIYSNIRKFVYFLLACNVGEILIVFGAMLFGHADAAAARAAPVAEPGDRRRAGAGARAREGRPRHHEAAAALAEGAGHQPRHGDRHRRRGRRGHDRDPRRVLPRHAALPRPPGGRADDGLRDALHLRAHPRLRRPLRVPQRLLDRRLLQPLDGRGRGRVVRARPRGGVRAVPRAVLRHRAAHRRATGC